MTPDGGSISLVKLKINTSFTTQVWRFIGEIEVGDRIVIPRQRRVPRNRRHRNRHKRCPLRPRCRARQRHQRSVTWELLSEPRSTFGSLAWPMANDCSNSGRQHRGATRQPSRPRVLQPDLWVNQGQSSTSSVLTRIAHPARPREGTRFRFADVGRVLTGDTIIHY